MVGGVTFFLTLNRCDSLKEINLSDVSREVNRGKKINLNVGSPIPWGWGSKQDEKEKKRKRKRNAIEEPLLISPFSEYALRFPGTVTMESSPR